MQAGEGIYAVGRRLGTPEGCGRLGQIQLGQELLLSLSELCCELTDRLIELIPVQLQVIGELLLLLLAGSVKLSHRLSEAVAVQSDLRRELRRLLVHL